MPIYTWPGEQLPESLIAHYEQNACKYWDTFYKRNDDRFFSDRHYLQHEFPELTSGPITLLEAGCGVGNTVFPVLEANPEAVAYACDFSPHAVSLVRQHALHAAGRVHGFVADLTQGPLTNHVPAGTVDFCLLIFVLSAIDPGKMPQVLHSIAETLNKGFGRVLVRDYAAGDLAESRLAASSRQQKLQDNFYVRGDGTRAYYFSTDGLLQLFSEAGYSCEKVQVHERTIENRRKGLLMDRRWIQAVFLFTGTAPLAGSSAGLSLDPYCPGALSTKRSDTVHFHAAHLPLPPTASGDVAFLCSTRSNVPLSPLSSASIGAGPQAPSQDLSQFGRSSAETAERRRDKEASGASLAAGREWEHDTSDESCECAMSKLFGNGQPCEEVHGHISLPGVPDLSVCSVSRAERHTLTHTGLMLWEAAPALARYVLSQPALMSGKRVLEIGSGGSPAVVFAALRHCRRVVATDGSPETLRLLERNVCTNASLAVIERLRLRRLEWGEAKHEAALLKEFGCFDLIVGADVVYVEEALPLLLASSVALLRREPWARLVLCHVTRRVSEQRIVSLASTVGLLLELERQLDGPIRVLVFRWQCTERV